MWQGTKLTSQWWREFQGAIPTSWCCPLAIWQVVITGTWGTCWFLKPFYCCQHCLWWRQKSILCSLSSPDALSTAIIHSSDGLPSSSKTNTVDPNLNELISMTHFGDNMERDIQLKKVGSHSRYTSLITSSSALHISEHSTVDLISENISSDHLMLVKKITRCYSSSLHN